jgi:iron complex outermembrane receptor protein
LVFSNKDNYNVGNIDNKGIELAASRSSKRRMENRRNVIFQNSKITKLTVQPNTPGLDVGAISGGTGNTIQNHQVGYAPSSFYVYEQAYGADAKPLDGVFIDRNKDGIVNEQNTVFIKPAADVFYGSIQAKLKTLILGWSG